MTRARKRKAQPDLLAVTEMLEIASDVILTVVDALESRDECESIAQVLLECGYQPVLDARQELRKGK